MLARNLKLAAAAGAAMVLAVGMASPTLAETTVRAVLHAELKILDSVVTTQGISQDHAMMVYDTLFGTDENGAPQPQMIDTYDVSADGKTYTFVLRPDLKFSDGAAVTADDVVASLKRWGAKDGEGKTLIAVTDALVAVDARTVRWMFSQPYGYVIKSLGKTTSNVPVIMPKRFADTPADQAITDAIGSGPFLFKKDEWVPGSKVVYVKNKNYVPRKEPASGSAGGKVVKVDRVEWLNIADSQTAINALINKEIDYYETPPADFLPKLRADRAIELEPTNKIGFQGVLRMNHLQPPFNNPAMRQAMLSIVNQETYMKAMFGDPKLYKICPSYFACGTLLETDVGSAEAMKHDMARAKKLIQEAGYKGEKIVVMHPTDVATMNAATLVTAQLMREAGLNVDLQAMDWATMNSRRANKGDPAQGGWNILHTWWNGVGISNPLSNAPIHASCDKAWPGWPCDEAHQKLVDAFKFARSVEEQKVLARKIQESAYKLVPYVPFGQWQIPVAYRKDLKGVLPVPGLVVFWNMEKAG